MEKVSLISQYGYLRTIPVNLFKGPSSNSSHHMPHNSYDVSLENSTLDQLIIPQLLIFFCILIACLLDIVLIS